jgi:uncharacterized protein YjiS (DUF1127 family)
MSPFRTDSSLSAAFPATGVPLLGALAGRLVHRFRDWLRQRAVLDELYRLDGRTLQDLQITRQDFDAIASGAYRRDGLRADEAIAAEARINEAASRVWPYF